MRPKRESRADGGPRADAAAGPSTPEFTEGRIAGVVVRDLRVFADGRGWLAELFREDELDERGGVSRPAMAYVSSSAPGAVRGPHEHREQADHFCFIGPSDFELRLWDNRPGSETFGRVMTVRVAEGEPKAVVVPAGVVHAYRNVGREQGLVVNFPDRLYMGPGRRDPVDEIRHEEDPATPYRMDD